MFNFSCNRRGSSGISKYSVQNSSVGALTNRNGCSRLRMTGVTRQGFHKFLICFKSGKFVRKNKIAPKSFGWNFVRKHERNLKAVCRQSLGKALASYAKTPAVEGRKLPTKH